MIFPSGLHPSQAWKPNKSDSRHPRERANYYIVRLLTSWWLKVVPTDSSTHLALLKHGIIPLIIYKYHPGREHEDCLDPYQYKTVIILRTRVVPHNRQGNAPPSDDFFFYNRFYQQTERVQKENKAPSDVSYGKISNEIFPKPRYFRCVLCTERSQTRSSQSRVTFVAYYACCFCPRFLS